MYCVKCGRQLQVDANFCVGCGAKREIPPSMDSANIAGDHAYDSTTLYEYGVETSKFDRRIKIAAITFTIYTVICLCIPLIVVGLELFAVANGIFLGTSLPTLLLQLVAVCIYSHFSFKAIFALRNKQSKLRRYLEIAALAYLVIAWSYHARTLMIFGAVTFFLAALYIPSSRQLRQWMGSDAFLQESVFQKAITYIQHTFHNVLSQKVPLGGNDTFLSRKLNTVFLLLKDVSVRIISWQPQIKKRAGIAAIGVSLVIILATSGIFGPPELSGTYMPAAYQTSPFAIMRLYFEDGRMQVHTGMSIMFGNYEIDGDQLTLDVSEDAEFNNLFSNNSDFNIQNGEIVFSFRKQGGSIWLDGKEYSQSYSTIF